MTPYRFSANTGYLWKERPFLDRIRCAAANEFQALEFHDEAQREDRAALKALLAETGLPVIGLNVRLGDTLGCAAIPGAADQAKRDISEAIEVAEDLGAGAVHVLAGVTGEKSDRGAYLDVLRFALKSTELTILIEPICSEQVPGYFLSRIDQAGQVLVEIGHPRLKIMFDCYHVHHESGALLENFSAHAGQIGHVQIAAAEARAEPFPGELDYSELLPAFKKAGYSGAFGCEYRPRCRMEEGLRWRALL
jgi:hydroxypyruvate isomerase